MANNKRIYSTFMVTVAMLAFLAGLSTNAVHGRSSKKSDKGWVFDIRSDRGGHQVMYLSPTGVRFNHKSFTAVLKAPDFDAVVLNTSTKKYTRMPYETWMKRYGSTNRRSFARVGKPATLAGFKTFRYQAPSRKPGYKREFWMTTDLVIPDKVTAFVSKVMNVPEGSGLPLKIASIRSGTTPLVEWQVVSYKRQTLPEKMFTVPAGYKKVESEMELLIQDSAADGMADLLR